MCYLGFVFNQLTNFAYQRNWKEAVGFYVAYLLLMIIVGAVLGGVGGNLFVSPASDFSMGFNFGVRIGTVAAIVLTLVLCFLVLKKKNLLNHFGFIILAILSGLLAVLGGGILGLIPVAYLTTKASQAR